MKGTYGHDMGLQVLGRNFKTVPGIELSETGINVKSFDIFEAMRRRAWRQSWISFAIGFATGAAVAWVFLR